jgi:hypothetical protein
VARDPVVEWRLVNGRHRPVTAAGVVPMRDMLPDPSAPGAGMSFIEFRDGDSGRRLFWTPAKPARRLTPEQVRKAMARLRAMTDDDVARMRTQIAAQR